MNTEHSIHQLMNYENKDVKKYWPSLLERGWGEAMKTTSLYIAFMLAGYVACFSVNFACAPAT